MRIALVDASHDPEVTPDLLAKIRGALEVQLYAHYGPFWQQDGVPVIVRATMADLEPGDAPLVVFDDPDQPGVLGYHGATLQGEPFGKAFMSVIRRGGGDLVGNARSLSVTLSHEALEMAGDPYASWWADVSPSTGQARDTWEEEALEVCDRVEADAYIIANPDAVGAEAGVAVSNFLGPRAFRDGPGPYDWMRLLESPWEIRPGGYAIRRAGGPGGVVTPTFGAGYPAEKREVKEAAGRAMLSRAPRFARTRDQERDMG